MWLSKNVYLLLKYVLISFRKPILLPQSFLPISKIWTPTEDIHSYTNNKFQNALQAGSVFYCTNESGFWSKINSNLYWASNDNESVTITGFSSYFFLWKPCCIFWWSQWAFNIIQANMIIVYWLRNTFQIFREISQKQKKTSSGFFSQLFYKLQVK